jgi:periplasmic protein TonB
MHWSMLPVSAGAHAAAVAALVIIPLAAETELPVPASPWTRVEFVAARAVPEMPRERARLADPVAAPRSDDAAPISAPSEITPEIQDSPVLPDVPGALPADALGAVPGSPAGEAGGAMIPPVPPPPPPPPPRPIRPGGDVRLPEKVFHVAPRYPDLARAGRVQGLVILEAVIDERGTVTQIRVLRSVPLLDHAAIEAVRQWRYTPTLLNGTPVPVIMTITCRFSLSSDGV